LSRTQYQEGAVNFLDVIDADRTVLQAQRAAVQLAGLQAVSTVNLIRAMGGGWSTAPSLANTNDSRDINPTKLPGESRLEHAR
jgi:multidrug efflux system outer membrane protein